MDFIYIHLKEKERNIIVMANLDMKENTYLMCNGMEKAMMKMEM